jgi:amino acid adenylation domain-containing protein
VERTPDGVALVFDNQHLTYRELNARANQLANYLRGLGVGPETVVGLYAERSLELVVGLIGILKAGGAYLPIDPVYPKERIGFLLEDAGVQVLLTQEHLLTTLAGSGARTVCLDSEWHTIARETQENLPVNAGPENLAYIIYTSGSTGQPKGCLVTHYNVVRLMQAMQSLQPFGEDDVWTLFHSHAFDFSVWEIWGALFYGGRLVVVPYWTSRSPERFHQLLREQCVTVLNQTPSAFRQLMQADEAAGDTELALRVVILGGEALELASLRRWFERRGDQRPRIVNMYGITETTVHVTYRPITLDDVRQSRGSVIGAPLPDIQLHILDEQLHPVPVGVPGEICVGGPCVARGYLNRPELTRERFIQDPFSTESGNRLYRSGDLARRLDNGDIEYLGRIDRQVKIRGFRIELGEIEAALIDHSEIAQAVVVAREDRPGDQRLAAYLVASNGAAPGSAELRRRLKIRLPDYMLPSSYTYLKELPLTSNGKFDRNALPAPTEASAVQPENSDPARNPVEKTLASIWSEVLDLRRVGIHDNFFDLGGHSITAIRALSRIVDRFEIELSLRDFFAAPTIARMAELVAQREARPSSALGKPDRRALPLPEGARLQTAAGIPTLQAQQLHQVSFLQETLLLQDRLYAGTPAYNICRAIELRGRLDAKALAEALNVIVQRHSALRTIFVSTGSVPLQKISATWPNPLRKLDLTLHQNHCSSVLREEARTPFDLASDLMLRALLIRLADERHILVLTVHHIAFDGWSRGILFKELSNLYRAFAQGATPGLPELPIQYAEFAESERKRLRSGAMDADLEYWRRQLTGAEPLRLPFDHPSAAHTELRGASFETHLGNRLVLQLELLARQENATLFMVMLAAFQALLHRSTGQQDILVAVPVANRPQPEVDGLIGLFLKTVMARAQVQPGYSFRQLLAAVRDVMFEGLARQEVPEDRLVETLQPPGVPYMGPPIHAVFVMQSAPEEDLCLPGLEVRVASPHNETAKFNLTASVERRDGELFIDAEYNSDLFEAGTVRRLMASYIDLLNAVSENPAQAISSLPLPGLPVMLVATPEPAPDPVAKPTIDKAHANKPYTLSASNGASGDPILARLRVMWRDLLGLRSIQNDDNFFELGGHSLLAARLIVQIEKAFSIKLNLNSLFHAPTLVQLAAFIGNGVALAHHVVVPIQPAGLHPPFLCLGGGPMYLKLARLLGPEQPFLGVPGPDPALLCEPFTLENYAALQVEAIRKIQPNGPYCLGGWSASAVAAYEAARQLRAQGEKVALLVLFDGVNPAASQSHARVERLKDRISGTAARVRYHASNIVAGGVRNFLPYLRDRLKWQRYVFTLYAWSFVYRIHQRLGRPIPSWMRDPAKILIHCFYRYQPAPYAGRTLLLRHASRPKRNAEDPLLGWGGLCVGEFEACDVPGNHREIFIEPNVQVMAKKLSHSLQDVYQEACQEV